MPLLLRWGCVDRPTDGWMDGSTRHPPRRRPPWIGFDSIDQALGSEYDGPYDMRAGDEAAGVEGRADVYTAVTEAIGLKRRVRWGAVVCLACGEAVGLKWRVRCGSDRTVIDRTHNKQGAKGRVELKVRSLPLEGATEDGGEIRGIEMWNKWKLGKGLVRGVVAVAVALAFLGRWSVNNTHKEATNRTN